MDEVHEAPPGGKGGDPPARLDFTDRDAVRAWLAELRTQIDDAVEAGEDATRPLGQRALGRPTARRAILEARRSIRALLAVAERGVGG